ANRTTDCTTSNASASTSAKWPSSTVIPGLAFCMLPQPLVLQSLSNLAQHVVFVVFRKYAIDNEQPVRTERSFGDHALLFTEEIRQDAVEANLHRVFAIGHREIDMRSIEPLA